MGKIREFDISTCAFAFRGYNLTNIGKSGELMAHRPFFEIISRHLDHANEIASDVLNRRVDLAERIQSGEQIELAAYGEAVALIVAMEQAQIEILREFHDLDIANCRFAFGYSLGEISALVSAGVLSLEDALSVPLELSKDCASLAEGVSLAIIFSKQNELDFEKLQLACFEINQQSDHVIGVSAILAPNSCLVMGQEKTIDLLKEKLGRGSRADKKSRLFVRRVSGQWPPLHTPIVWQKDIPTRAARLMHKIEIKTAPTPNVFSLVTGKDNYSVQSSREILYRWTDQPQLLWEGILELLNQGIETVVHVGPEPNIIPATLNRLSDNVMSQVNASFGMRAMSGIANRRWLAGLIPQKAMLLRAPQIRQITLEDWLLSKV